VTYRRLPQAARLGGRNLFTFARRHPHYPQPTVSESIQGSFYDEHQDYVSGSPHLKHLQVRAALLQLVFQAASLATARGLPAEVLEIGGGDGSVTEPLLANGLSVTTTEMSTVSTARLASRFSRNDRFRAVHDPDGSLQILDGQQFSCILFASVLHHIPDYLSAISHAMDSNLRIGGSLVSIQDPLWYPRMNRTVRAASDGAYLSWRALQGGLVRGVQTKVRRLTRGLQNDHPSDTVEYHVVRNGVDEDGIARLLSPFFEPVVLKRYWSTQGSLQQRLGEGLRLENTFAILGGDFRGTTEPA
jgi:hypothetical protein